MRAIRNMLYIAGLYVVAVLMLYPLTATPANAQLYNPPSLGPNANADVRSAELTLNTTGDASWDITAGGTQLPFAGAPDVTHIPQAINATDMLMCNYVTRTTTTISVHCIRVNPLATLLTGVFGGTIAGTKVNLIARYKAP